MVRATTRWLAELQIMNMEENGMIKMLLWFEEKMSVMMNMNRNVEQNTGLCPHFFQALPIMQGCLERTQGSSGLQWSLWEAV